MWHTYAPVMEDAAKRQRDAGVRGKEGGRGRKKTHRQQIAQGKPDARKTSAIRARAAGTNRIYIDKIALTLKYRDIVVGMAKGTKSEACSIAAKKQHGRVSAELRPPTKVKTSKELAKCAGVGERTFDAGVAVLEAPSRHGTREAPS